MNANRRARIAKVVASLEALRSEIEELATDERDAFENMPESLQDSDRGQQSSAAADALESADSDVQSIIDSLTEITE